MKNLKRVFTVLILCFFAVFPLECFGAASSGGSGGGSGGKVIPMRDYTVTGTISLPDGFAAPEDGLPVYCCFGGVSLTDITPYSTDESTLEYEKIDELAVIACGETNVSYKEIISLPSDYDGFYIKFWTYNPNIASIDTTQYLSNKIVTSNIVKISADKNSYSNVNAEFEACSNAVSYVVNFAEDLKDEKPNQTIYLIADDGYDKFVTKKNFSTCNTPLDGILRAPRGNYSLSYYIPSTERCENQKIETGTHPTGDAYLDSVNPIFVNSHAVITGTISRPEYDDFNDALNLRITTSESSVKVKMGSSDKSVKYTVAATVGSDEFLHLEANSDYYQRGYFNGEKIISDYCTLDAIDEYVKNIDLPLQMQGVIIISAKVPSQIAMGEKTFFPLYVNVKNTENTFSDTTTYFKFSDSQTYQTMYVPYEYKDDDFVISYHYGSYNSAAFPNCAKNPLKTYYQKPNGGSSGGGGGGHTNVGAMGYSREIPDGLLCNRLIYVGNFGATLLRDEAKTFRFVDLSFEAAITLAKENEIAVSNSIGGYFCDIVSHCENAKILLLDAQSGDIKYETTPKDDKYIFSDVENGKYIISAFYDGENHYYNGTELSDNIAEAKTINANGNTISYGNDMYCGNVFPANISCKFNRCLINGVSLPANIGVYDIYGKLHFTLDSEHISTIPFSPFILRINGDYVSGCDIGSHITITGTSPDYKKAKVFKAEYADLISPLLTCKDINIFYADIAQSEYSVTDVNAVGGCIECEISKNFESEIPAKIFYCVYSTDGNLKKTAVENAPLEKGTHTVRSSKITENEKNSQIKVFVWGENLAPL